MKGGMEEGKEGEENKDQKSNKMMRKDASRGRKREEKERERERERERGKKRDRNVGGEEERIVGIPIDQRDGERENQENDGVDAERIENQKRTRARLV
ncbi:hypothetical protein P168DRAFT_288451 [Aspergillus campestris IBT 28561]|uniref:Uncharacterized protein n=1 Tax=Aspergillus campestris (strain IBT 28561) TaxID=1392248 RepID=A0A2I1D9H0_ASPC2|nr:uncharacterized protein P168DRAFT_288451 [Aspergillus campestris IBT 28561]PKY06508.1 hypothetical protein P168DRAFT_288451 [Aspergillus campestris IBT 28561]